MGLMDKVKAQATQVAQKAQDAAQVGQSKVEGVQAKRKTEVLLHDLGAAVWAQHKSGGGESSADVDRILGELSALEASEGPFTPDTAGENP